MPPKKEAEAKEAPAEDEVQLSPLEAKKYEDEHEEGALLAETLQAEQEARPDDHELVVAAKEYNEGAEEAAENPPVPVEEEEAEAKEEPEA